MVRAEGTSMGPEASAKAVQGAEAQLPTLVGELLK